MNKMWKKYVLKSILYFVLIPLPLLFNSRPSWAEIAYRAPHLRTPLIFFVLWYVLLKKKHVNIEYFGTNLHFWALYSSPGQRPCELLPSLVAVCLSVRPYVVMSTIFYCSYIARSSLTYIPGFSAKFFFQPIYTIMQIRHILIKDHI